MRVSVRRGLTAAVTAALTASLTLTAAAVSDAAPATAAVPADFYTPPGPLPSGRNGDVIKSAESAYRNAEATRIMYLSRDAKDHVIPVTGTVIVPTKEWTGPGPRPIVAYTPFTAGLSDQCAPSKTLAREGSRDLLSALQNGFVDALLGKGFAVAQTDYEGMGVPTATAYAIRRSEAHTTLDAIRAAQRLPGTGLPKDGPVGVAGYSQGGGASAAAAELASSYAPELDLKGAFVGAPPANKDAAAKSFDGGMYSGFLGLLLADLDTAYPEARLLDLFNDQGRRYLQEARTKCALDVVFSYWGKDTEDLTKDGRPVAEHLSRPPFDAIVAENKLGTVKPSVPTMVDQAPNDDVLPFEEQGRQLAEDWCAKGATVQLKKIPVLLPLLSHVRAMPTAWGDAADWLTDRFAGKPATSTC
ncbi:lipase family protein [Streptomyces sp. B1866]|uniref:lipase family protein n=1 Tax=Streptomyces sp. B1866 TaxID=3075431 RepID=UPI00288E0378|nr:lipase family protein [Streptomyces sp. B1866]MDT3396626.1 lipase family protein [Streptomyces sp. B1866]